MKPQPKTVHETPPPPQKIYPLEKAGSKKNLEPGKPEQPKNKKK